VEKSRKGGLKYPAAKISRQMSHLGKDPKPLPMLKVTVVLDNRTYGIVNIYYYFQLV
jgi:hypothetical protein